jgi:cytochrome oxidase Cu insertion factor (SCO1/SenC/PrrC family)
LIAGGIALWLTLPLGLVEAAPDAVDEVSAEQKARNYFTDLEVVDQNGARHRFYTDVIRGRVVLINFVYTHCKDACPMATQKLTQVRELLDESINKQIWFVSISIDPENDTPGAMKAFMNKLQVDENRWLFLTGEKRNLDLIVKRLGQYANQIEAHSTLMLAGNDRTRHWIRVMPMASPSGVAQQLQALVDDSG